MNEIKIGAVLNYIRLFVKLGIGFFLSPFILESLGRAEFGIYSIAGTIIGWLALCDFGLTASTTKFLCEYQAKGDGEGEAHFLGNVAALFSVIGCIVLVSGLCIYPFLGNIFPKFSEEELKLYRILYLMTLLNTSIMFPTRTLGGIAAARQKYVIPGTVNLLLSLCTTGVTIIILLLGYKSIALCATGIFFGVVGLVWGVYYCFVCLKARIIWKGWDFSLCKSIFAFSFWMFLDQLICIFNWGCGTTIIGMTQGAAQIAVYAYGLQLMQYYFMASNCISSLFLPKVVKLVALQADKEKLTDLWIVVARVHVLILGFMLTCLVIFGRQFLSLWVGRTLGESTNQSWVVALLLIGTITVPLVQCLGWQILQAYNAIRIRVKILLFVAAANLLLGYFLSIRYGAIGLAMGTAVSFILGQWIFMNLLYQFKIGLNVRRFFMDTISGLGVPCLIFAGVGYVVLGHFNEFSRTWEGFSICAALFALLYGLCMLNFYAKSSELSLLPSVFQRLVFVRKKIIMKSKIFSILKKIKLRLNSLWDGMRLSLPHRRPCVFLFGVPFHSNLGDQAQTYCILNWIETYLPKYQVCITMLTTATPARIRMIRKCFRKGDILLCHSGYHLTDLYHEKDVYEKIAKLFPEETLRILPQTIYFREKAHADECAEVFNANGKCIMLCRDAYSYETAQTLFAGCRTHLYPDIVTSQIGVFPVDVSSERDGVLFCMRNDKEALYSKEQIMELRRKVEEHYVTRLSDTTIDVSARAIAQNRRRILAETFADMSKSRVVVTDRYHGTIFSLVSNTPVIVVNSTDHKLSSGVKWFPESFREHVFFA